MTVFLVTAEYDDGRSLVIGVYANYDLANATVTRLRDAGVMSFVTETDVIGA